MKDKVSQETLFSSNMITNENEEKKKKIRKQKFKPYDQEQSYLFPSQLDEYVGPYHIARLVSAFIDKIEMGELIEGYKGGASAYNPRMLLKVWILGYLYRIYTGRPLARTLRENAAFMWISGNQQPDFHTLCNFRNRLKEDIKTIFREIVKVLLDKGIIDGDEIFIDHTKMEANANRHKIIWRKNVERRLSEIERELDSLLKKIEKIQKEEDSRDSILESDPERTKEALGSDEMMNDLIGIVNKKLKEKRISRDEAREQKKDIRRTKKLIEKEREYKEKDDILGERKSYSKTDPDASVMMTKEEVLKPGYNEGIAVNNGFVIAYNQSQNAGDNVSFKDIVEEIKDTIGKNPGSITTDGAYGSEENFEYMEEEKITSYLKYNTFHMEQTKKYYEQQVRFESFEYNKKTDSYKCPQGNILYFKESRPENTATGFLKNLKVYAAQKEDCENCPIKQKCTKGERRKLTVNENYNRLKKATKENLLSEKGKEMRKKRGHNVETVFGDRKGNHKFRRFHLHGIKNVFVESGLFYCMYNIKKLYKVIIDMRNKEVLIPLLTE